MYIHADEGVVTAFSKVYSKLSGCINKADHFEAGLLFGKKALKKFGKGVAVIVGGAALGAGLGFLCGVCLGLTPAAYKIAVGYSVVGAMWINS